MVISPSEIAELKSSVTTMLSQVCQLLIDAKQILLNLEDVQKKLSKIADNQAPILQNSNRTSVSQEAASANQHEQLDTFPSDWTTGNVPSPEPLLEETQWSSFSIVNQHDPQISSTPTTEQVGSERNQNSLLLGRPPVGANDHSVDAELLDHNDQPLVRESESSSHWLEQIKPLKSPYYPQVGDKMYQVVDVLDEPWTSIHLDAWESCLVKKISFELLSSCGKPLRLCSVLLARDSGEQFTVRYHDLNGVVDFVILRSLYDKACSCTRRWAVGSRFRCAIEDSWQFGRVVDLKCPLDPGRYPDSIFKSMRVKWDGDEGLIEEASPWELEPVDDRRLPLTEGSLMPILPDDVQDALYVPMLIDWPAVGRNDTCRHFLYLFKRLLEVPIVQPFDRLINNAEPNYLAVVSYPIDLATICERMRNNFYRRCTALLFDLEQLAANIIEVIERPIKLYGLSRRMRHDLRVGYKYKKIGEILVNIGKGLLPEEYFVPAIEELQNFPESQELAPGDNEGPESDYEPSICTQSDTFSLSTQATNRIIAGTEWQVACQRLLNILWDNEASVPFRYINNEDSMHLHFIREYLPLGHYKSPVEFANDVKNVLRMHDKKDLTTRKEIYTQAKVLRSLFDPQMVEIIAAWRENKNSGIARRKRKSNELQQNVDDTGDSPIISPSKKYKNLINCGAGTSGNNRRNIVQDDSEHEKTESENGDNSDSVRPYRIRSRTSKNDDDESDPQMADDNSTEYYSSSTTSESDDPYEEEDEDEKESGNQIPLAERKKQQNKIARRRKHLVTIDPIIKFTSSCDIMKYKPGNSVYITGVVSYIKLIENQYSVAYKQEYEILEFTISNGDGKFVHCKAWETDIQKIEKKIKKNNVVRIAMASATYPSRFNRGNIQHYELLIKNETKIEVLGRKRS